MLVGITLCIDRGKRWRLGRNYLYVAAAYGKCLSAAGASPVYLWQPADMDQTVQALDGLLIPGGDNLPATRDELDTMVLRDDQGGLDLPEDLARIRWERELVDVAEKNSVPILGLCYGMQLLNLHFGGTLNINLTTEDSSRLGGEPVLHNSTSGGRPLHRVARCGDSSLLRDFPSAFETNSAHDQAIARLAPGFRATAKTQDGVLEAMEAIDGRKLYGAQWHPETDETGKRLFARFVDICGGD